MQRGPHPHIEGAGLTSPHRPSSFRWIGSESNPGAVTLLLCPSHHPALRASLTPGFLVDQPCAPSNPDLEGLEGTNVRTPPTILGSTKSFATKISAKPTKQSASTFSGFGLGTTRWRTTLKNQALQWVECSNSGSNPIYSQTSWQLRGIIVFAIHPTWTQTSEGGPTNDGSTNKL